MRKIGKILVIMVLIATLVASAFVAPITMAAPGKAIKPYNSVQSSDEQQEDNGDDDSDEGTLDEGHENETSSEEPEEPEYGTNETIEEEEREREEEHEEEVSHEVEDEEEEHELHMIDEEDKVRIVSDDNEIEFRRDKPRLRFEYVTEDGYEVRFEVRFKEIYEFVDTNGNGKLDSGEEIFKLDMEDLPWNIESRNGTYVEINCTWYEIIYMHVSEDFNITFVMRVYQKSLNTIDGGADEVKIDVIVSKWKWHNDSSLLALLTKMEIEAETEGEIQELPAPEANETGIYMKTAANVFIKYEWTSEIFVNNELSSIVTSYYKKVELEQEMEQDGEEVEQEVELEVAVFTVYPHFDTLRHDPSVGVEDDPVDVQRILEQISIQWYVQPKMLVIIGILATIVVAIAALVKKNNKKGLESVKAHI